MSLSCLKNRVSADGAGTECARRKVRAGAPDHEGPYRSRKGVCV